MYQPGSFNSGVLGFVQPGAYNSGTLGAQQPGSYRDGSLGAQTLMLSRNFEQRHVSPGLRASTAAGQRAASIAAARGAALAAHQRTLSALTAMKPTSGFGDETPTTATTFSTSKTLTIAGIAAAALAVGYFIGKKKKR